MKLINPVIQVPLIRQLTTLLWSLLIAGCVSSSGEGAGTTSETSSYPASGLIAQPLPVIVKALANGEITSVQLVQAYLERIETVDDHGPALNAVLSVNPDALLRARELDDMRRAGNVLGPLHGIPVLVKDNIETLDNMPTTAGALALKDNITRRDSPLVAGLRSAGAIILGKTNLSQWANFRSEDSISGWSALGGQVRNPHMLDRNPCGSSAGSGAATAASLAAASIGTETNGSIICPSSVNGIVGFKPTVGIVPQDFIIPISVSQDTAGPMTKTVMGAAMLMNAMATTTPNIDYTSKLLPNALEGVRVGVLRAPEGAYIPIKQLYSRALEDMQAAGAVLIEISELPTPPASYGTLSYDLMKYEFKDGLNKYLASTSPEQVTTRSLEELIAFNNAHAGIEQVLFDQSIFIASEAMGLLTDPAYAEAVELVQKASGEEGIDKLLDEYDVAVLVSLSRVLAPGIDPINGDTWPAGWPGAGGLAARAGYPHATVPMGAFRKLPLGLSFVGTRNEDAEVLAYAFAYEQHSLRRVEPEYLRNADDIPEIGVAMKPYKEGDFPK